MGNRYLLTGAAGFVGHHYARHLIQQGHQVIGLDRLDAAGYMGRLAGLNMKFIRHDLAAGINQRVDREIGDVDYVVHLAAASHVDRSVTNPEVFLRDNIVATFELLQWARTRPIKKLLNMSTDEVFGAAPRDVAFQEHDAFAPTNPYAAMKSGAEMLSPAWAATFGLPIVVVRSTNIYGSGQDDEKFIPLCVKRITNDQLIQIHADETCTKSSTRYYLHVSDVCRAFDIILDKGGVIGGVDSGRYNLTGELECSNLEVAKQIAELLGKPLRYELVSFVANRPRHDMAYRVSWTKLAGLGWEPLVPLELGLKEALGLLPPTFSELGAA